MQGADTEFPSQREALIVDRLRRRMALVKQYLGPETPARRIQVLLTVYLREPATRLDILGNVKGSRAALIGDLKRLSSEGHRNSRGLGMITARWCEAAKPYLEYTVTPYGMEFLDRLALIDDDSDLQAVSNPEQSPL